jgi:hypothetical protein
MAYILRGEDVGQPHQCSDWQSITTTMAYIEGEDVGQPLHQTGSQYDHYSATS